MVKAFHSTTVAVMGVAVLWKNQFWAYLSHAWPNGEGIKQESTMNKVAPPFLHVWRTH